MTFPSQRPAYSPSHYLSIEEVNRYLHTQVEVEHRLPMILEVEEEKIPPEPKLNALVRSPKLADMSGLLKKA